MCWPTRWPRLRSGSCGNEQHALKNDSAKIPHLRQKLPWSDDGNFLPGMQDQEIAVAGDDYTGRCRDSECQEVSIFGVAALPLAMRQCGFRNLKKIGVPAKNPEETRPRRWLRILVEFGMLEDAVQFCQGLVARAQLARSQRAQQGLLRHGTNTQDRAHQGTGVKDH